MRDSGWVKLHRKTLEHPVICKDADHMAVWMYLLLKATHAPRQMFFGKEKITLEPGQLITGRKVIAEQIKVSESKVQRILKTFENEQQIVQQASNKNRLITIVNWCLYQESEQQVEQQANNKRTTSEQQVNTNKNVRIKELKKDIKDIVLLPYQEIVDYLNEKADKHFKADTEATKKHIRARFAEGYTLDDFKTVIDVKVAEWKDTEMDPYLRPNTLFAGKFEGYLNQKTKQASRSGKINKFDNFQGRKRDYASLEEQLLRR